MPSSFGIYFHWPFCAAKCPYCDFNSHVRSEVDHDLWREALLTDLRNQAGTTDRIPVTSVFFGGGTPSLMEPSTVEALLAEVSRLWPTDDTLEVTLEANPTSVEAVKFQDFRNAGVNRVSMGIQALNDPDLKALGRMHTACEALAAFDIARGDFERVSFDLIYARQNQTFENWEAELSRAIGLSVDHLSLYQLTIEAGTRFGDMYARDKLHGLPDDALSADMYDLTQALCRSAGMAAYEVSNHARSGLECRHNLTYWRYDPYLGVGPGAHGRVLLEEKRSETQSFLRPEAWIDAVHEKGVGTKITRELSASDQATEYALMSLRLTEGMNLDRFRVLNGEPLDQSKIDDLISQELVTLNAGRLATTQTGTRVLNSVLQFLLL